MKSFFSFAVVSLAVLLQGCTTTIGVDNSFGARAARDVKQAMAHDMCPWGAKKSDIKVQSRIEIESNSRARYRGDVVSAREEYSGRNRTECNEAPTAAPVVKPATK